MDKRFIPAVIAAAQAGRSAYKVPASVTLAQWALESRYGEAMPEGSNNPFGIKARDGDPFVVSMTWEVEHGVRVHKAQKFRKFDTLAAAFEAHARLLATSQHYTKAMMSCGKPDAFARALTGVYATDPDYGSKLIAIMKANNLYAFDSDLSLSAPVAAKPAPAPAAAVTAHPAAAAKAPTMNPISGMLTSAKVFATVVPQLLAFGTNAFKNAADIEAQAKTLVTRLEAAFNDARHLDLNSAAADVGAAWKAGMQIFADVGLSREIVDSTVASLPNTPALSTISSLATQAEALAKKLGLPV